MIPFEAFFSVIKSNKRRRLDRFAAWRLQSCEVFFEKKTGDISLHKTEFCGNGGQGESFPLRSARQSLAERRLI